MSLTELTSKDELRTWRERINELMQEVQTKSPIQHSSKDATYGQGGSNDFGHVKLSDDTNNTSDATMGVAATPKAVSQAYTLASQAVRVGEKVTGVLEANIKGSLDGNASTATMAEQAKKDDKGNIISETYVSQDWVEEYFSSLNFDGVLKRGNVNINEKDILTDTSSSFLYQTGCNGYFPALNLCTKDGRVGFGTDTDSCLWTYFKTGNSTNQPDASIDLSANGVSIKGNVTIDGTITSNNKPEFKKGLSVEGDTTVQNFTASGTANFTNVVASNNMNVTGKFTATQGIKAGAGSSFETDLYVTKSNNKTLIIRNEGSKVSLLVSQNNDELQPNSNITPLSFTTSDGKITFGSTVTTADLQVKSNINATGTITGSKVYNATFNDYAEFFERGEDTEEGDIISLDKSAEREIYHKALPEDNVIVGVHSETYGHIVGGESSIEESMKDYIPVGLCGRVKTKIYGSIKRGEPVVLSGIPGVGRKYNMYTDRDIHIIGYAVESKDDIGISLVRMKLGR